MTKTYSTNVVLDSVFPPDRPKPSYDTFTTGLGGVCVVLGVITNNASVPAPYATAVEISISSSVDYMDAQQLAEFFTALSLRLKAQK